MAKSKSPPKAAAKFKAAPMPEEHSFSNSADLLARVAAALERLAPAANTPPDFDVADAFSWHPKGSRLVPVPRVNRVEMMLLKGIDRMRDTLVENTERFARGLPANN